MGTYFPIGSAYGILLLTLQNYLQIQATFSQNTS